ncbi:hypothetical protein GGR56DRAFT_460402 [Xylariaceae sp. FL0804]|nr:hypothetical protein GGR56DRAFT_460402 [Xylariaceae sp. FL0804]
MSTTTTTTTTTTETSGKFVYMDPPEVGARAGLWTKVDNGDRSFAITERARPVYDLRAADGEFTTDTGGFSVHRAPLAATERFLDDDEAVREVYYPDVEAILRKQLRGVKKVVIFDHTVRRRLVEGAPRGPVQQVHVDQTPGAAATRVRRHVPDAAEAESLLAPGARYQIVNVWRPLAAPAADFPLAVLDWRSTLPEDFMPVDLLYPKEAAEAGEADAEWKKLARKEGGTREVPEGYEVKGTTMGLMPSDCHRFYYQKDMTPDEVLLLKCYDSWGEGEPAGRPGIALNTPHSAFEDPATPAGAPGRQSIEVRCLVFYE